MKSNYKFSFSLGYENEKFDVKRQIGDWRGAVSRQYDDMYKTGNGATCDFQPHQVMLIDIFGNKACPNSILVSIRFETLYYGAIFVVTIFFS